MSHNLLFSICLTLLNLGAPGLLASWGGQPQPRDPGPSPAQDRAGSAVPGGRTVAYADHSFGFELSLPADWVYERSRFTTPDHGIGLLQGAPPDGSRTLQILLYRTPGPETFPEWIERFERDLARGEGTLRVAGTQRELADRFACVIEADAEAGGIPTKRLYFCVPFDPTTYWVLVMATVGSAEPQIAALRGELEAAAASLRILYTPVAEQRLAAGLELGRKIVEKLPMPEERLNLPADALYFEIRERGEAVGFMTQRFEIERRVEGQSRKGQRSRRGLRVGERVCRFAPDGAAEITRTDAFVSFDDSTELIETQITQFPPHAKSPASLQATQKPGASASRPPAAAGPVQPEFIPPAAVIALDQCVRYGDELVTSYSVNTRPKAAESRPPIKVGPAYLPAAWTRMLPRLLLGDSNRGSRVAAGEAAAAGGGEEHAFIIYDPITRGLVTCLLRAVGSRELPGRADQKAMAFEVRQGFAAAPAQFYADSAGDMLLYSAGDLTFERTSKAEIDRRFAGRIADIERRLGNSR